MGLCRRRVLVMGVPGVGKTWLLQLGMRGLSGWRLTHIPSMLDNLSMSRCKCAPEQLDVPSRRVVRQAVSEALHRSASAVRKGIICEGHMAHLPAGDEGKFVETAFTDHDKTLFNEILLMEASPDVVLERRRLSGAYLKDSHSDEASVKKAVAEERARAIDLCRETGARLRVIDLDFPDRALAVIRGYLRNPAMVSETYPMAHRRVLARMAQRYGKSVKGKTVFLFDADGTLSDIDVSFKFMELIDREPGKSATKTMLVNFRERGRSFASYIYHELYHRDHSGARYHELCGKVADEVKLFPGVRECLLEALDVGAVAILTAGVPEIWEAVLRREGVEGVKIFGLVDKKARLVMDEQGKQCFAEEVKRHAARLVATGDSVIDLGMMRVADAAFMVVNWPDLSKANEKKTESSEISKMYIMLNEHPLWRRIKAKPTVELTVGAPEVGWGELVGVSTSA